MANTLKPKFAGDYRAIVSTIETHPNMRQGDIADANRSFGSRPTILTRMKELVDAGVIERVGALGSPSVVRYKVLNMASLDALTGTKKKAAPASSPAVEPVSVASDNLTEEEREVMTALMSKKAPDKRGWTYTTTSTATRPGTVACKSLNGLVARGLVWMSEPRECGTVRRFRLIDQKAPVEAPQSVETPVEAPAMVEAPVAAPTAPLTLAAIIEQAVQAAMAVAAQRDAAQIANLIAERDAAREQLAAVKKLLA